MGAGCYSGASEENPECSSCQVSGLMSAGSGLVCRERGRCSAAYGSRQGAVREEVSLVRERQAQAVRKREVRKVGRHGMFLLN